MAFSAAERRALIERYENGPLVLEAALARVPAEAHTWRPGDGRWSVHEVVVHCADSETNGAGRIKYLLAEEKPVIVGYDQDRWARVLDYHAIPLESALATVRAVRAWTAPLLRRVPESAWGVVGTHTESGRFTPEDWLKVYAEHLEVHGRQIERNLEAWMARAPSRPPAGLR